MPCWLQATPAATASGCPPARRSPSMTSSVARSPGTPVSQPCHPQPWSCPLKFSLQDPPCPVLLTSPLWELPLPLSLTPRPLGPCAAPLCQDLERRPPPALDPFPPRCAMLCSPVTFRSGHPITQTPFPDTLGDFVILRSNGLPVYNFCVAIDDALMGITHVLRAEEHLPNTLRQVSSLGPCSCRGCHLHALCTRQANGLSQGLLRRRLVMHGAGAKRSSRLVTTLPLQLQRACGVVFAQPSPLD